MFGFGRRQIGTQLHSYARPFEEFLMGNPNTVVHSTGSFNYSASQHTPYSYHSNIQPATSPISTLSTTSKYHSNLHHR